MVCVQSISGLVVNAMRVARAVVLIVDFHGGRARRRRLRAGGGEHPNKDVSTQILDMERCMISRMVTHM